MKKMLAACFLLPLLVMVAGATYYGDGTYDLRVGDSVCPLEGGGCVRLYDVSAYGFGRETIYKATYEYTTIRVEAIVLAEGESGTTSDGLVEIEFIQVSEGAAVARTRVDFKPPAKKEEVFSFEYEKLRYLPADVNDVTTRASVIRVQSASVAFEAEPGYLVPGLYVVGERIANTPHPAPGDIYYYKQGYYRRLNASTIKYEHAGATDYISFTFDSPRYLPRNVSDTTTKADVIMIESGFADAFKIIDDGTTTETLYVVANDDHEQQGMLPGTIYYYKQGYYLKSDYSRVFYEPLHPTPAESQIPTQPSEAFGDEYLVKGKPPQPTYETSLSKGWNMFSFPYADAFVTQTDCGASTVWHYSSDLGEYAKAGSLNEYARLKGGAGYWVKASEDCTVVIEGSTPSSLGGYALRAGWNQVGAGHSSEAFGGLAEDCEVASGPWRYDAGAREYVRASALEPGKAYFVKVVGACVLGEEALPPGYPKEAEPKEEQRLMKPIQLTFDVNFTRNIIGLTKLDGETNAVYVKREYYFDYVTRTVEARDKGVYAFNIKTLTEKKLSDSTPSLAAEGIVINGNKLAFTGQDSEFGNCVYVLDLESLEEKEIVCGGAEVTYLFALAYGDKVVFAEEPMYRPIEYPTTSVDLWIKVYLFNPATQEKTYLFSAHKPRPTIKGGKIVFADLKYYRHVIKWFGPYNSTADSEEGPEALYVFDVATKKKTEVDLGAGEREGITGIGFDGNKAVFFLQDWGTGEARGFGPGSGPEIGTKMFAYDIQTSVLERIKGGETKSRQWPDIDDGKAVWSEGDQKKSSYEDDQVFVYDSAKKTRTQLTTGLGSRGTPKILGNDIVYDGGPDQDHINLYLLRLGG